MLEAQCQEVDDYLLGYKTLVGVMPPWVDHYDRDFQVRWGIADFNQVERGELVIVSNRGGSKVSIIATFRQRLIYRLDVEPPGISHPNPISAAVLGLPPFITGSHYHGWSDNRSYVLKNGFGQLPHRRPIEGPVGCLADGLGWTAEHLGITVTAEQRVCPPPPQGLL